MLRLWQISVLANDFNAVLYNVLPVFIIAPPPLPPTITVYLYLTLLKFVHLTPSSHEDPKLLPVN